MPIIKSAVKRAKQTIVRRERNIATKQSVKSATKAFLAKPSAKSLSAAQSAIDTAVKKNVLPKNTAARRKARLSAIAKEAGVKLAAAKKPTAKTASATKKPATKAASTTKKPVAAKTAPAKKPTAKPKTSSAAKKSS